MTCLLYTSSFSVEYISDADKEFVKGMLAKMNRISVREYQGVDIPVSYTHLDVYKRQHLDLLQGMLMFQSLSIYKEALFLITMRLSLIHI